MTIATRCFALASETDVRFAGVETRSRFASYLAVECANRQAIFETRELHDIVASVLRPPLQNHVWCPTSPNPNLNLHYNPKYL